MFLVQPGMQLILWNSEQRNIKSCTEHWGVNVCWFILCHSACLIHIYVHLMQVSNCYCPANGNAKVNKCSCSNGCRQQEQSPSHGYKLLLCVMRYIHRYQFSRVCEYDRRNRSTVAQEACIRREFVFQFRLAVQFNHIHVLYKGKGKSVPLQAWSGPEGSRKFRFPDFMTRAQDGGRLSALRTDRPYPQEMLLVLRAIVRPEGLGQ